MNIKSERDFWGGLMLVVTGIGFAWGATNYSFGDSANPGPAYFPFGLGTILALLGAAVLFKALTVETAGGEQVGSIAWKQLVLIVGAVALFGVLLPWLGLMISLVILVFIASMAGHEFRWGEALVSAVLLALGCWLVFIVGLNLTIPLWPTFLGF